MDNLIIYLLLLLAVVTGWLLGRLGRKSRSGQPLRRQEMFADYFVGLNYLLNDEPDEAIDTFINALEINHETKETHLALGALLRRRGKVDEAIKVHQSLLGRPDLDQDFVDASRLELAIDYVTAGLLDRAERLLQELVTENSRFKEEALNYLVTIYQTEKDWEKAMAQLQILLDMPGTNDGDRVRRLAAHFCCEIADQELAAERISKAREWVRKAFVKDRKSTRASLLLARIEMLSGNIDIAIRELDRIIHSNSPYAAQAVEPLYRCHEEKGTLEDLYKSMQDLPLEPGNPSVLLSFSELDSRPEFNETLVEKLLERTDQPVSARALLKLAMVSLQQGGGGENPNPDRIVALFSRWVSRQPGFRCEDCGFDAMKFYWQCPSCHSWGSIQPKYEG